MIQYMPFTYIAEDLAKRLTGALGPLAIWQPLERMTPLPMRTLSDEGRLHWRRVNGLDPTQLERASRAFSQWGELHQGKTGNLNTFFRAGQEAGFENSIQQIRSQIRHREDNASPPTEVRLFQAALFLCLAQQYDEQQDVLVRQLGSVQRLEAQFGKIIGEADDPDTAIGPSISSAAHGADPGLFMTEKRLQAWARLAATQAAPDSVYLTTSGAVYTHLMALFPDALQLAAPPAHAAAAMPAEAWARLLRDLSQSENPKVLLEARCGSGCGVEGWDRPSVAVLMGISPGALFQRIQNEGDDPGQRSEKNSVYRHTVIVYLPV